MNGSENASLHSIISGGGELELVGEVQLGQRLEDVGHAITKLDLVDGVGGRCPASAGRCAGAARAAGRRTCGPKGLAHPGTEHNPHLVQLGASTCVQS